MVGTVKWFNKKRGYGFIVNPEGKEVFVHHTKIEMDGFRELREGEKVEYEQATTPKGVSAFHVRPLRGAIPRAV